MTIPRNVLLLGIVSMLNDIGSSFMISVLPLFVIALGGGGLALGLVGGIGDATASAIKVFAGWWSDRIGKRKPFIWAGYGISASMRILMAFAASWPQLLVTRSVERLGKLREAPRDSLIADTTPPKKRGLMFGIHQAMDTTGSIFGSIMAFILVFIGLGFSTIILLGGFVSAASLIALWYVKDVKRRPSKYGLRLGLKELPRKFKGYLAVSTLFALGNFTYFIFISRAGRFFDGPVSILAPVGLYVVFNIVSALSLLYIGKLSDAAGRGRVLVTGYFLFSAVCIGFAVNGSLPWMIVLFILYGIFTAVMDGSQRAYVVDIVKKKQRGTALGVFHGINAAAILPGSVIAGLLYDSNPTFAFLYGAAIGFVSALLLYRLVNKK